MALRFSAARSRLVAVAVAWLALVPAAGKGADYDATYSSPPIPELCPGRSFLVPVTVTNTGSASWPPISLGIAGPIVPVYYLTYHLVDSTTTATTYEVRRTYLLHSVQPGQTVTLDILVDAPPKKGPFIIRWEMASAGMWFSNLGVPTEDVALATSSSVRCLAMLVDKVTTTSTPGVGRVPRSVFDGPEVVTPGGIYVLSGVDFGSARGTAVLIGNSGQTETLEITSWNDTVVGVKLPSICGWLDQDARIELVPPTGERAPWSARFMAKLERLRLTQDEMQVVNCFNGAGRNRCNDVGSGPVGATNLADWKNYAVTGQHQSPWANTSGVDQFSVALKNGWEIESVSACDESEFFNGAADLCTSGPTSHPQATHSATSIDVSWKLGIPFSAGGYLAEVFISGPCGVPHR